MLKIIITPSAIIASNQFEDAFVTADGASERPMHMIIGPVTTGGRNFITLLTPTSFITIARTKYNKPATTIPPHIYAALSLADMPSYMPVFKLAIVKKPPRNANDDPKNAGT